MSLPQLPDELLSYTAAQLDVLDLCALSRTSKRLNRIASDDGLWRVHLRRVIPSPTQISAPDGRPLKQLYASHSAHWFLTREAIFFADTSPHGKVIYVSYDPRRGCIEGHALTARCGALREVFVELDGQLVSYRPFNPIVNLDLNYPVLSLPMQQLGTSVHLNQELTMARDIHQASASFLLSRFVPPQSIESNMALWPPLDFESPSGHRMLSQSPSMFHASGHKPDRLSEVSQATFRIRQWTDMHPAQRVVLGSMGRTLPAETILNFAALDKSSYVPTADKPYQGLWVGDFATHGCEEQPSSTTQNSRFTWGRNPAGGR